MKQVIPAELLAIAKKMAKREKNFLEMMKVHNSNLNKNNFVWHTLLVSFSTMGKSKGYDGLMGNTDNYNKLNFDVVTNIPSANRLKYIENVCRLGKIRMPAKKAEYILGCHNLITEYGGMKKTKNKLFKEQGREAKINFLKRFTGIGDKYARNIMMDAYHEDFRNSIAVDLRIKEISSSWSLSFATYEEHEDFYLELAKKTKINGWELDRLMYNFKKEFLRVAYCD